MLERMYMTCAAALIWKGPIDWRFLFSITPSEVVWLKTSRCQKTYSCARLWQDGSHFIAPNNRKRDRLAYLKVSFLKRWLYDLWSYWQGQIRLLGFAEWLLELKRGCDTSTRTCDRDRDQLLMPSICLSDGAVGTIVSSGLTFGSPHHYARAFGETATHSDWER